MTGGSWDTRSRVVSLEEWRKAQRELNHEQRISALERSWAKLAGASAAGSILGGGVVALIINQVGG